MAAARQKEMKESITEVATTTLIFLEAEIPDVLGLESEFEVIVIFRPQFF